jgi:hypothetical protein
MSWKACILSTGHSVSSDLLGPFRFIAKMSPVQPAHTSDVPPIIGPFGFHALVNSLGALRSPAIACVISDGCPVGFPEASISLSPLGIQFPPVGETVSTP